MSYPILYNANATDFFNLGLGLLDEATRVHVTEERNGSFYLEIDYPIIGKNFSNLKESNIIKVDAGPELLGQRFRISQIGKASEDWTVTIYAEHVSYMSQDLAMMPIVHIVGMTCQSALNIWKNSLIDPNPFIVSSDILTVSSTVWHIRDVQNPRLALGGVEGSLLDCYGGEYKFDNYHISLLKQRGKRANTMVSYGRNIIDIQQEENITNTYTSIYPYATYEKDNVEKMVTVDGYQIDSEHVTKYPHRKVLPIDFSSEFDQGEVPTKAKLEKLTKDYIQRNNIGVPDVSIKLTYLDLAQTLDYKDIAANEVVNLCDELPVSFERLGIETTAKVVRIVWDVLLDRYDSIELGNTRKTLSTVINNIEKQVNQVQTTVNEVQIAANGKNMVFRGPDTPTAQNVGDQWYKPNGDDVELYIWDGLVWEFIMSTKPDPKIQEAIDEAKEAAEQAQEDADAAMTKADESNAKAAQAVSEAGFAKDQAAQAQSMANNVNSQLPAIKQDAKDALDAYNNLEIGGRNYIPNSQDSMGIQSNNTGAYPVSVTKMNTGGRKFQRVRRTAVSVNPNLMSIYNTINTFSLLLGRTGPVTVSFKARTSVDCTSSVFMAYGNKNGTNSLLPINPVVQKQKFTTDWNKYYVTFPEIHSTTTYLRFIVQQFDLPMADFYIDFTDWMLETGNQSSDWSADPTDVQVQITNLDGQLSTKVSQTQFNLLQGTVTSQGTQINQNKTDIALKANQSTVNVLTGRVDSAESALSVQSGKIGLLTTTTDGHTAQIGYLTLTSESLTSTISSMRVGGTNLLKDSDVQRLDPYQGAVATFTENQAVAEWKTTSAIKVRVTGGSNRIFGLINKTWLAPSTMKDDTSYTHSIYVKNTGDKPFEITNNANVARTIAVGEVARVVGTYKNPPGGPARNLQFNFARVVAVSDTIEFVYWHPQIEEGNMVSDWSNAPQDDEFKISTIQQTVNGLQVTVANKAEQSQVTQLAGQITSVVTSNKNLNDLSALSTALILDKDIYFETTANNVRLYNNAGNGTVGIVRENMPAGSQPSGKPWRIKVTTTGVANPGWGGVYQNTTARINAKFIHKFVALLPVGREFMRAGNSIGTNSSVEWLTPRVGTGKWETYAYITRCGDSGTFASFGHLYVQGGATPTASTPLVWYIDSMAMYDVSQYNQSQITQLSNQITLEVNTINANKADKTQLTLLQDQINLKVQKGDTISQINIEAGKTLIQTNSLILSAATVTFTGSAFIPAASIINLNADKITAGTINAASVNIINLNANNIVSGSLNAINIIGGTITGSNIYSATSDRSIRLFEGRMTFSDNTAGTFGELAIMNSNFGTGVMLSSTQVDGHVQIYAGVFGGTGIYKHAAARVSFVPFRNQLDPSGINFQLFVSSTFQVEFFNYSGVREKYFHFTPHSSAINLTKLSDIFFVIGGLSVSGSKNAIHVTRSGIRATPAYETAESFLGDIGRAITQDSCQVWVPIEELFSDTVNTDIPYEVFLQVYENAKVWVTDFKSDAFLVCSDRPFVRFVWEIKAKRRGFENDRLVIQEKINSNKDIEEIFNKPD